MDKCHIRVLFYQPQGLENLRDVDLICDTCNTIATVWLLWSARVWHHKLSSLQLEIVARDHSFPVAGLGQLSFLLGSEVSLCSCSCSTVVRLVHASLVN